jgi:hypothetical protein
MTDLLNNYGWRHIDTFTLWRAPGTLKSRIIHACGQLPDVILFWEGYHFLNANEKSIKSLECDKYIFTVDLHWSDLPMRIRKRISLSMFDTILSSCGYIFQRFYPDIYRTKNIMWIPHSASQDFMLDCNTHAENAIFLSGAINSVYPLRQRMKELCDNDAYPIIHHEHPGYHCRYNYESDANIGAQYARKINKYRIGFTDCSIYSYIVAKYFEIPSTGALLLADDTISEPFRELGFIENIHYVPVSMNNLEEKIQYVLHEKHHPELDEIRKRGQALVWEKHTTSHRARLIDTVCTSQHAVPRRSS